MAFTRGYRLYPDGRREPDWDYGPAPRVVRAKEVFAGFGWLAPPASLVFRARAIRSLPPFFESVTFGDIPLIMAGSIRGGAFYDPTPTICYRIAHPASFTIQVETIPRSERIRFLEGAIRHLQLAGDFYGFPMRHLRHRLDDYRLSIAKLCLAERQPLRALKALAAIHPGFFVSGALRRLLRRRGG